MTGTLLTTLHFPPQVTFSCFSYFRKSSGDMDGGVKETGRKRMSLEKNDLPLPLTQAGPESFPQFSPFPGPLRDREGQGPPVQHFPSRHPPAPAFQSCSCGPPEESLPSGDQLGHPLSADMHSRTLRGTAPSWKGNQDSGRSFKTHSEFGICSQHVPLKVGPSPSSHPMHKERGQKQLKCLSSRHKITKWKSLEPGAA